MSDHYHAAGDLRFLKQMELAHLRWSQRGFIWTSLVPTRRQHPQQRG